MPVSPYDDVLPPEEFERRLAAALESARGAEGEEMRELIDWFFCGATPRRSSGCATGDASTRKRGGFEPRP